MAKPEWGTKRICLSCGARFYDLKRDPIVCPACGAPHDPMAQSRPRRSRAAAAPKAAAAAVVADEVEAPKANEVEAEAEVEIEPEEEETEAAGKKGEDDDEEEDTDAAIEDVSELGADEDMSDVIDTEIDEEEGER